MKIHNLVPRPRKRTAGYSLTEVLVAVMVLATIAIAFYAALSAGFTIVQSTREDLRATQILVQKTEAIRLCTWDQLANFSFQEPYDPMTVTGNRGTVYTGTVTTNQASSIPEEATYKGNLRLVTLTVSWTNLTSGRPVAHTREMQTQVARYGLQNYIWGTAR